MSQGPRRHLRLENVDGVTVVSFVESKIVTEENIQEVGDQLYSLVEDEGHRNLLLNFGNVQYLSSAALGKLINLKRKAGAVKGKLKLCCIHPDLLEVFRITRLDQVSKSTPTSRPPSTSSEQSPSETEGRAVPGETRLKPRRVSSEFALVF